MQKTFPEEFESMKDKMAIEFKKSANNKESDKEKQINFDLERKRLHAQKG